MSEAIPQVPTEAPSVKKIEWCPAFGDDSEHLWGFPDKSGIVECLFCHVRKLKEAQ